MMFSSELERVKSFTFPEANNELSGPRTEPRRDDSDFKEKMEILQDFPESFGILPNGSIDKPEEEEEDKMDALIKKEPLENLKPTPPTTPTNSDSSDPEPNPQSNKRKTTLKKESDLEEAELDFSNPTKMSEDRQLQRTPKKRLIWTQTLHKSFIEAVTKLGDKAVPKKILREMGVDGLSRENIASHLQKYRLQQKKYGNARAMEMTDAELNSPPSDAMTESEQMKRRKTSPSREPFYFDKATNTDSQITHFVPYSPAEIPPQTLVLLQQRANLDNILIQQRQDSRSFFAGQANILPPNSEPLDSSYFHSLPFAYSATVMPPSQHSNVPELDQDFLASCLESTSDSTHNGIHFIGETTIASSGFYLH